LRSSAWARFTPLWLRCGGFDEPGHLAYILFIDDHGRVPGFTEPSFPRFFLTVNRNLPSTVGVGAPSFAQWHAMSQQDRASRFVAALLRCRKPLSPALPALIAVAVAYGFAMWGHMFNGVLARLHNPNFPLIGAEGWYLDEMRTIEAAVIAAIAAVIDVRRVARTALIVLALANLLGIALYMAAMEAMPVRVNAVLPLALLMLALAAIALAIARLSPRPAAALSAPADSRAPYTSTARSDQHR
jgi:hypothetical protein